MGPTLQQKRITGGGVRPRGRWGGSIFNFKPPCGEAWRAWSRRLLLLLHVFGKRRQSVDVESALLVGHRRHRRGRWRRPGLDHDALWRFDSALPFGHAPFLHGLRLVAEKVLFNTLRLLQLITWPGAQFNRKKSHRKSHPKCHRNPILKRTPE